jgi:hypothetical protein
VSNRKYPYLILIFVCLLNGVAAAKPNAYFRATGLVEEDPLEADALFASVIRNSGEAKIRRAAMHQLFYLRLRSGRIAEAFPLVSSEAMRDKYDAAVAAHLKIPEKNAGQLIQRLRSACGKNYDLQKLAGYLEEKKAGVASYDFALRVLKKCRSEDALEILPQPEPETDLDKRALALALIAIREGNAVEDGIPVNDRIGELRSRGAAVFGKDAALRGQLLIIEARLALRNSDFPTLTENCRQISEDNALKKFRGQCRFLTAFALIKEGKPDEAYLSLATQKIEPGQVDHRLLRIIAGVAAGKMPREKLRKFMQRASYPECAPILRELAENTLK